MHDLCKVGQSCREGPQHEYDFQWELGARRIVVLIEFGAWAEHPSHKGSFSWLDLRNRIVCNVCLAVCTVS